MQDLLAEFQHYNTLQFQEQITRELVDLAPQFDDNEELIRVKAECLCKMLRRIVSELPPFEHTTPLPHGLTPQQGEALTAALQETALKGIRWALTHALQCIGESQADLCTSKLAVQQRLLIQADRQNLEGIVFLRDVHFPRFSMKKGHVWTGEATLDAYFAAVVRGDYQFPFARGYCFVKDVKPIFLSPEKIRRRTELRAIVAAPQADQPGTE